MKLDAAMPFVVAGRADWARNMSSDLLHDQVVPFSFSQITPMPRTPDMKIPPLPFTVTDWSTVAATVHPGETGEAIWRTFAIGDLRVRQVEYTPGYLADHWCDLGHVLYVLEGELETELRDGRTFKLLPGMSYQVSHEGDSPHRSSTRTGAKLFIVD